MQNLAQLPSGANTPGCPNVAVDAICAIALTAPGLLKDSATGRSPWKHAGLSRGLHDLDAAAWKC